MYIEYVGKRLSTEEADDRTNARYLFEVNSAWTIDGSPRHNLARYINHACKPSCESLEHRGRIFIKAIRAIQPGEELTYDYGSEYFEEFIGPHRCRCRSCTIRTS
jgi:uncharacterized protein